MRSWRRGGWGAAIATCAVLAAAVPASGRHGELPSRIPEAAPYDAAEASLFPPPYEELWSGAHNTGTCAACHPRIHRQWNGSMMANAWRDPAWRAAFLLISRLTATDGDCDVPDPPDGSPRSRINPFANGDCTSTFDTAAGDHTTGGSGSLLDDFCSRCHMPANYVDNVPLADVVRDPPSGLEHGLVNPHFDPTSARGTGTAFATDAERSINTENGKVGIACEVCHSIGDTRRTPFHNYEKSEGGYVPALGEQARSELLPPAEAEFFQVPDPESPSLGYAIGAGSYRLSPHALARSERFGPLAHGDRGGATDPYASEIFGRELPYERAALELSIHDGYYHVLFERAELCGVCHDVTNPLTIRNQLGHFVGGFPIERTYTEWSKSRYADRPGNANFEPAFKRDCQSCHMQQDLGRPGTAQVLYAEGEPVAPLSVEVCQGGPVRSVYHSHFFIGGNAYVPRLVGANADPLGRAHPYPELSAASFSSASDESPYHDAWFETAEAGPPTRHARLAWDRLRHVLELELAAPAQAAPNTLQPIRIRVTNTGSGHNFPTGFPEGRNAWVAVRAFDLGTGRELQIYDLVWDRRSRGVGYLTGRTLLDPNFPDCGWMLPAGSPDPYAHQFRAVASLGDGCPTLDLPYATPLNLEVSADGLPLDGAGRVIGRANPLGLPRFRDLDGDGDVFDDAFLIDQRLRPPPNPAASVTLDRYSVVVPENVAGPVAVTAAVYYQSLEATVARKFLGNLADTDLDRVLEPCVLGAACDGRTPGVEPAVVEGAPPVPMEVRSVVISIDGHSDRSAPRAAVYPEPGAEDVYADVVVKAFFSEPVEDLDASRFSLVDVDGVAVPASVDQIGDFTWALFPDRVFLESGARYAARIRGPVCDAAGNCASGALRWSFRIAETAAAARGDTRVPIGVSDLLPPAVAASGATRPGPLAVSLLRLGGAALGTLCLMLGLARALAYLGRDRA